MNWRRKEQMRKNSRAITVAIIMLILFSGTVLFISGCANKPAQDAGKEKVMYHCPMHPTYTSDRPGDCPICGMKLVPIESEEAPSATEGPSGHEGHSPLQ